MTVIRDGLSIDVERGADRCLISLKAAGKLTHEDYEKLNPMIDSALDEAKDQHVDAYIDASEFEGWELRAAWDDIKLGFKHGKEFDKVSVFGNKKWQEYAANVSTWFVSGESKYFEDADSAKNWLKS